MIHNQVLADGNQVEIQVEKWWLNVECYELLHKFEFHESYG